MSTASDFDRKNPTDVTDAVRALHTDGIAARKEAFDVAWADGMREDIERAFDDARDRPGGAVGRGPHRYYVEMHPRGRRSPDTVGGAPAKSSAR